MVFIDRLMVMLKPDNLLLVEWISEQKIVKNNDAKLVFKEPKRSRWAR